MKRAAFFHFCLILSCLWSIPASSAFALDADDLAKRIEAVDAAHPRLFFGKAEEEALGAKIAADPLLSGVLQNIVAQAEDLADAEFLKREKEGKRLLGVSRECLRRVSYLAFAWRMTGDDAFLRRAEAEMLAVAGFTDWNPDHFLDVAEMTAALAIGYDWLYKGLTPEARTQIRDAIIDKGLKTSLEGGWWVTSSNNWNQVCHGGLVLGALAVLEDEADLARDIIARAVEKLPIAMAEYEPDGVYPEGPSYWKYGTSYNVLLIAALESVLGSDFGLESQPGFMKTPDFYLHVMGPTGLFYNYSDGGTASGLSESMHWFAGKLDRPGLLWNERHALEEFVGQDATKGSGGRLLPFLLIWGQPMGELEAPQVLNWKGDGRTPVALLRSAWDKDATYVGIKGGSPGSNHAHMDIGSFVLDRDGVRWAVDLGAQDYNSLESKGISLWDRGQDSQRWDVFRLSNMSHNTLVVDGKRQLVRGDAPIERFSDSAEGPFAIIDMTPVFEGQLQAAKRGARLHGKNVLIQDEVKALEQPANIRWGMATQAEVTITEGDPSTATLTQDGKTLTLHVIAPEGVALKLYEMETPPQEFDVKNPNTRMIGFEIELGAGEEETVAVVLGNQDAAPDQTPLAEW